ncbi:hypothetical protein DDT56_06800 [Brenneria corticis]|uniref:Uncharacterized protein n=1 Tax=Brenneria corticis TaxID=2173106 RepID=A0A2U1U6P0_9GAMM|nr:hypothetical protein DDT56_06800 [Brenneria sp. CFCC 11842]
MRFNTKVRIALLAYLVMAFAVALPVVAFVCDLIINGVIIDLLKSTYSFSDFYNFRRIIYLRLSLIGAILGGVLWLFFYRKYTYHDPLDRYFTKK